MNVFGPGDRPVFVEEIDCAGSRTVRWRAGADPVGTLVFCHGFMAQPSDYSRLLAEVASHGIDVIAPVGHRRGYGALSGRRTVDDEVHDLIAVLDEIGPATLGGHSRGAQVAWIVASMADDPRDIVAIDPVDGGGRHPTGPHATVGRGPRGASVVVGTKAGGRCTPSGSDHHEFAASSVRGGSTAFPGLPGTHLIIDMGHADILDPIPRFAGRLICGGRPLPECARRTVARILVSALTGAPLAGGPSAIVVG